MRDLLWLMACLEGVSGSGNSRAGSRWKLEEYYRKALLGACHALANIFLGICC